MAPRKNSIVVLETSVGQPLVIRANPTIKDVRRFVEEHTRRFLAGEAGGPSGIPAYRIYNAKRYTDELSWLEGETPTASIDIEDLLPT